MYGHQPYFFPFCQQMEQDSLSDILLLWRFYFEDELEHKCAKNGVQRTLMRSQYLNVTSKTLKNGISKMIELIYKNYFEQHFKAILQNSTFTIYQ